MEEEELLDVCMVIGQGHTLTSEVAGFSREIPSRWLLEWDAQPYKSGPWVYRLTWLRQKLLERVRSRFWLSLDTDTLITAGDLRDGIQWLLDHPDWGGVGFRAMGPDRPEHKHVRIGCVLLRREATKNLVLRNTLEPGGPGYICECAVLTKELHDAGWKFDYHPTARSIHAHVEASQTFHDDEKPADEEAPSEEEEVA